MTISRHHLALFLTLTIMISSSRLSAITPPEIHTTLVHDPTHTIFDHSTGRDGSTFKCNHKTIRNLCYAVHTGRFVITSEDAQVDRDLTTYVDTAKHPPFERITRPLNSQEVAWVHDKLVLAPDFTWEQAGAHFWLSVWPSLHLIRMMREHFRNQEIGFWVHSVRFRDQEYEPRIWQAMWQGLKIVHDPDMYISPRALYSMRQTKYSRLTMVALNHSAADEIMPESPRVSLYHGNTLDRSKPYVCMKTAVVFPWVPCKSRVSSYQDALLFKRNFIQMYPNMTIPDTCRESPDKSVAILQRRVFSRKISNLDALVRLVAELAQIDPATVDVFDGSNRLVVQDFRKFRYKTFLISVHGAGNVNYIFLPKHSHVVEIMPYFMSERMYEKLSADLELHYYRHAETDASLLERTHPQFAHLNECRGECPQVVKRLHVMVTLTGQNGIHNVLKPALQSWKETCLHPNQ